MRGKMCFESSLRDISLTLSGGHKTVAAPIRQRSPCSPRYRVMTAAPRLKPMPTSGEPGRMLAMYTVAV
jgi:hypothetical protein